MIRRRIDEIINFRKLERETWRLLSIGFVIAVVVNIAVWEWFAISFGLRRQILDIPPERIVRMNIRTLTRPPRIPMTVTRPAPRRQAATPQASYRREIPLPESGITTRNLPGFEGPDDTYQIADIDSIVQAVFDTDIPEELELLLALKPFVIERIFQDMSISRIPDYERNRISLRDEMLRVEDLDVGKYQALAVIDPEDSRNITGFIHIPNLIWGESLFPPREIFNTVKGLSEALKMDTGIITTIEQQVMLDSLGVKQYPFVVIAADQSFDLTLSETASLAEYLQNGGFVFAEAYGPQIQGMPPPSAASLRRMFHDALGRDLRPIENTHMIYHVLYDFDDGPPSYTDNQVSIIDGQPIYYLEGIWVGDRLAGIYSEKGYAAMWGEVSEWGAVHKLGVNLMVYSMLQQDGMTFKLVDDR